MEFNTDIITFMDIGKWMLALGIYRLKCREVCYTEKCWVHSEDLHRMFFRCDFRWVD